MESHQKIFPFAFKKSFSAKVICAEILAILIPIGVAISLFIRYIDLPYPTLRMIGLIPALIMVGCVYVIAKLLQKGPLKLFDDHLYYKYGLFPKQVLYYKDISYVKPAQDEERHRLSEPAHGPVESTVVIGLHNGQERFLSLQDSQAFLEELSSRL